MGNAATGAGVLFAQTAAHGAPPGPAEFPKEEGLTREVAAFIVETTYRNLPEDVIELGKKSILDGLGLALSGTRAETGGITREYVQSLGVARGESTVIGTGLKAPARFAAYANGIGIHKAIAIDGLWSLKFGGGAASSPDVLYFTAGPNGEKDGLFGTITPAASEERER